MPLRGKFFFNMKGDWSIEAEIERSVQRERFGER